MGESVKTAHSEHNAVKDIGVAHEDLIAYLNTPHGEPYDTAAKELEEKTGVKREKFSYVLFCLYFAYLIFGALAQFACNLAGFAYPAYASVKAIRSSNKDDDTQWLTYWTVFAFFSLIDFFSDGILQYFPFYFVVKFLFLVYLYLPQTMGAQRLYENYVDPLVTIIDEKMFKKQE